MGTASDRIGILANLNGFQVSSRLPNTNGISLGQKQSTTLSDAKALDALFAETSIQDIEKALAAANELVLGRGSVLEGEQSLLGTSESGSGSSPNGPTELATDRSIRLRKVWRDLRTQCENRLKEMVVGLDDLSDELSQLRTLVLQIRQRTILQNMDDAEWEKEVNEILFDILKEMNPIGNEKQKNKKEVLRNKIIDEISAGRIMNAFLTIKSEMHLNDQYSISENENKDEIFALTFFGRLERSVIQAAHEHLNSLLSKPEAILESLFVLLSSQDCLKSKEVLIKNFASLRLKLIEDVLNEMRGVRNNNNNNNLTNMIYNETKYIDEINSLSESVCVGKREWETTFRNAINDYNKNIEIEKNKINKNKSYSVLNNLMKLLYGAWSSAIVFAMLQDSSLLPSIIQQLETISPNNNNNKYQKPNLFYAPLSQWMRDSSSSSIIDNSFFNFSSKLNSMKSLSNSVIDYLQLLFSVQLNSSSFELRRDSFHECIVLISIASALFKQLTSSTEYPLTISSAHPLICSLLSSIQNNTSLDDAVRLLASIIDTLQSDKESDQKKEIRKIIDETIFGDKNKSDDKIEVVKESWKNISNTKIPFLASLEDFSTLLFRPMFGFFTTTELNHLLSKIVGLHFQRVSVNVSDVLSVVFDGLWNYFNSLSRLSTLHQSVFGSLKAIKCFDDSFLHQDEIQIICSKDIQNFVSSLIIHILNSMPDVSSSSPDNLLKHQVSISKISNDHHDNQSLREVIVNHKLKCASLLFTFGKLSDGHINPEISLLLKTISTRLASSPTDQSRLLLNLMLWKFPSTSSETISCLSAAIRHFLGISKMDEVKQSLDQTSPLSHNFEGDFNLIDLVYPNLSLFFETENFSSNCKQYEFHKNAFFGLSPVVSSLLICFPEIAQNSFTSQTYFCMQSLSASFMVLFKSSLLQSFFLPLVRSVLTKVEEIERSNERVDNYSQKRQIMNTLKELIAEVLVDCSVAQKFISLDTSFSVGEDSDDASENQKIFLKCVKQILEISCAHDAVEEEILTDKVEARVQEILNESRTSFRHLGSFEESKNENNNNFDNKSFIGFRVDESLNNTRLLFSPLPIRRLIIKNKKSKTSSLPLHEASNSRKIITAKNNNTDSNSNLSSLYNTSSSISAMSQGFFSSFLSATGGSSSSGSTSKSTGQNINSYSNKTLAHQIHIQDSSSQFSKNNNLTSDNNTSSSGMVGFINRNRVAFQEWDVVKTMTTPSSIATASSQLTVDPVSGRPLSPSSIQSYNNDDNLSTRITGLTNAGYSMLSALGRAKK